MVGSITVENFIQHKWLIHQELISQLHYAHDFYKEYVNDCQKLQPHFNIGYQVWLLCQNIQTTRPSKKLDYKKLYPFQIICQVISVTLSLALPTSLKIHLVFHVS